jgi:NDP-sugar pyrophosphorylase family protein
MQCIILAGGLGSRISAIAGQVPKALVPVNGCPFAHYQLTLLARAGIRRVVYSLGHRGEQIRRYVEEGSRWGLEVTYVDEGDELRGTAGALRLAFDRGALEPSFFVLYGDSYLPIDYRAVWDVFQRSGRQALMTVFRNAARWDTSNVLFERGRIVLYDKRRVDPRSALMDYIDYGLTVFSRGAVERYVPPGGPTDLADVYHQMSVAGELGGFEVTQRFYEVGSPSGLDDLSRYLLGIGEACETM